MDERGRLKRPTCLPMGHLTLGEPVQLFVDERPEAFLCRGAALARGSEQRGNGVGVSTVGVTPAGPLSGWGVDSLPGSGQ